MLTKIVRLHANESKFRTIIYSESLDRTSLEDGILTVVELASRAKTTTTRKYAVTEQAPLGGHRSFLVVNQDSDEVYESLIPTMPGYKPKCSCPAGCVGNVECVHVASITGLILAGALPDPRDNGEQDTGDTEHDGYFDYDDTAYSVSLMDADERMQYAGLLPR